MTQTGPAFETKHLTGLPSLTARPAGTNDLGIFPRLARLYAEDRGFLFDDAETRRTFADIERADFAINLLFGGNEAIGFALLRLHRQLFSTEQVACEEVFFIARPHRSLAAESVLHEASIAQFEAWGPAARELQITSSSHATEMALRLAASGFHPANVTTRQRRDAADAVGDRTMN